MKIEIILLLIISSVLFFDFVSKKKDAKGIRLTESFGEKTSHNYQILIIQSGFVLILGLIFVTIFTHVGTGHRLITLNSYVKYYIEDILEGNLGVIANYMFGFIFSWCIIFWRKIVKISSKVFFKKILAFFILTNLLKVLIHFFIYPYEQINKKHTFAFILTNYI